MKETFKTLSACALVSLSVATAQAITITDTNAYGTGTGGRLIAVGSSFTDSFQLSPYNPGTQIVTSATASFTLFDNNSSNNYSIDLEGSGFLSGNHFSTTFTVGSGITGSVLGELSATGILSYTITNTGSGNQNANGPKFWLESATLTAQVSDSVPDGGATVALLGLSIIGIAAVRGAIHKRRVARRHEVPLAASVTAVRRDDKIPASEIPLP